MVDKKIKSDPIISAQPYVWEKIKKITSSKKIGNAYLFSGPPGCGKEGVAIKLVQLLNCKSKINDICHTCPSCIRIKKLQHENLNIVLPFPVNKNKSKENNTELSIKDLDFYNNSILKKSQDHFLKIKIPNANRILLSSIRALRKTLNLSSAEDGIRIVLVFDAHLLAIGQGEAGNAFLKLLEEPPSRTTFILVTDYIELILPTIISRSQEIRFSKLKDSYIESWFISKMVKREDVYLLTGLSRGNIQRAQFFITQSVPDLIELISYLIRTTTKDNPEDWRIFIQNYSKFAKQDVNKYLNHVMLLKIWFQSANRLSKKIKDSLHETSLVSGMKKLILKYPSADFISIVIELDNAVKAISMNLYMPLVLTNLLINTKKFLNYEK